MHSCSAARSAPRRAARKRARAARGARAACSNTHPECPRWQPEVTSCVIHKTIALAAGATRPRNERAAQPHTRPCQTGKAVLMHTSAGERGGGEAARAQRPAGLSSFAGARHHARGSVGALKTSGRQFGGQAMWQSPPLWGRSPRKVPPQQATHPVTAPARPRRRHAQSQGTPPPARRAPHAKTWGRANGKTCGRGHEPCACISLVRKRPAQGGCCNRQVHRNPPAHVPEDCARPQPARARHMCAARTQSHWQGRQGRPRSKGPQTSGRAAQRGARSARA